MSEPDVRRPSRIAVLPAAVADQIAAGEVVERPASAVKELVENALDAGATTIEVAIEDGGRALIRVADDGCGMSRDEVLLAIERHATSKIRTAADLVGVSSFGFRGEALPAIASVSRLEIASATSGDGTIVRIAGGAVTDVSPTTRRTGTTVSVAQLFYNVPARLKFLRSARSEWRAVAESLIATALCRRDLRLGVTNDGKNALTLPPASSMRARVAGIWGGAFAERFIEADDVSGPVHVSGLVERPADVGTASRRVFLSVNGRPIRDAGIARAAESAYRSTITPGVRPSLFLEIVLPADAVDVNVHPAKAEVRFRDRWPVERAVEHAVRRALGEPGSAAFVGGVRAWTYAPMSTLPQPVDVEVLDSRTAPADGLFTPAPNAAARGIPSTAEAPASATTDIPPLVQLRRTYLMFERGEGVVLIDQHSAHERILFEQFMNVLERGAAPSQRLLFPATLHLGPAEGDAFEANRDTLAKLGFEIEPFGGHSIIISSVPMPHPRFDALRCLRDTLDALTGDRVPSAAARHERLAATVACKAAIKAGDALSAAEMQALYVGLAGTTLPAHDVHGRSTIVQITWDELDRRFGRK